jgi:hypothetical protein
MGKHIKGDVVHKHESRLRLVTSHESPPPVSPPSNVSRGALPSDEFAAHEAITRKVINPILPPQSPAPHPRAPSAAPSRNPVAEAPFPVLERGFPAWIKQLRKRQILIITAVVLGLVGGAVGLWKISSKPATTLVPATTIPAVTSPVQPKDLTRPTSHTEEKTPLPETIRLEIKVEPKEATLTLDENVVVGNRLQVEVPKDRSIHVVSASAPGFTPFNQKISYSGDVHLMIELRHPRTPVRSGMKPRPARIDSKAKSDSKPKIVPNQADVEPGMNLERPSKRRTSKQIDERDPYTP